MSLFRRLVVLLCAASPVGANIAAAQGNGFDFTYGRWLRDSATVTYAVGWYGRLLGPLDYGLGIHHTDDGRSAQDRTLTGGELSLGVARDGHGLYAVGAVGLGVRHEDGNLDAQWSAGGGYALRLLPFLSLGLEARYRVEDQDPRGFWRLRFDDRRGLLLQVRVAAGGPRRRPRPAAPQGPVFEPPAQGDVLGLARESGSSEASATLAAAIVQTALDVMGTPYAWGGTNANGYDCSGLIQHAYGEHGILLPRVSRDQIRMGTAVEPRLGALRPGDILGFSVEQAAVTHVGLYVGDGKFIHSASDGVKLSSLTAPDPDSQWWQRRLVAARRIIGS